MYINKGIEQREISHILKFIKGNVKNDAYWMSSICLSFYIFYSNSFGSNNDLCIVISFYI